MNNILIKSLTVGELAAELEISVKGKQDTKIEFISTASEFKKNALCFIKNGENEYFHRIVIGDESIESEAVLISSNPRLDFCRALDYMVSNGFLAKNSHEPRVSKSASIHGSAILENGVVIGDNTIVEANVVIHNSVQIGKNCIIRANSVIGAQGFGFEQKANQQWLRFPHLGTVVINDDCEIGALNSICRGALSDTVIGRGTKTDNLVHIAHNCVIGENCILTACVELSGGVILEDNIWVGPNSSFMQKIRIGKNSIVGLGSVVTKNVDCDSIVAGVPAKLVRKNVKEK